MFKTIRELKYLAYHDILTGLKNRSYLFKKLDYSIYSYLYFIDLNNLKSFNKKGHSFGDSRIKVCVEIMLKKVYSKDCLIRYAGDEFLLFTNRLDALTTNKLYTVGCAKMLGCLMTSINLADIEMIKQKRK